MSGISGELTDELWDDLERLLRENDDACRLYIKYASISASLSLLSPSLTRDDDFPAHNALSTDKVVCLPVVGAPWRGTFLAWSQAYLVATVFLAVGLVIGMAVRVSNWQPKRVVGNHLPPGQIITEKTVGHITGVADCRGRRWLVASRQWSEIPNLTYEIINHQFFLGDRFVLSSGLMEITYETGAKVILEGPCTYEIESAHGGYLAVGKLTAKVEKGAGTRGQEVGKTILELDMQNPRSPGPWPVAHAPLFAVRTPTAIVTDLGTEFGVEVEKSGATRSHVFQGIVELRASNDKRSTTAELPVDIIRAGESVRVERGRNRKVAITREPGQPQRFVRQIHNEGRKARLEEGAGHTVDRKSSIINHKTNWPRYHLIDLGTLGGKTSKAHAINVSGIVVGEAMIRSGVIHAFLFSKGKMKDLGTLDGGDSWALGINATQQIVGRSGNHAFLYSRGVMRDLGTLGGSTSVACNINNAGLVVGSSRDSSGDIRGFLYTNGVGIKSLGLPASPKANLWANDINAAGQIVGSENSHGRHLAFFYTPGIGVKDLGTLGGDQSRAVCVNDAGQVVGDSAVANGAEHAFIFSNDFGMKDLGTFGGPCSHAYDINEQGYVVGDADGRENGPHAFLFCNGKMIDLNRLIDKAAGWRLRCATAINNAGQIAGYGEAPDGNIRAFLLTPVK